MTTPDPSPASLAFALKEWDLLCSALLRGEQAILLRKGGILESANEFELEHPRFLLFPTFIHQDPVSVKPAWRSQITRVNAEPEILRITGWAEVAAILQVPDRARMDQLNDLHLWDTPLIDMRFKYRPEKPLYLVVVRAFRLPEPVEIPNTLDYAGCKSWVPLDRPVSLAGSTPALPEPQITALIARLRATFAS